MFINGLQRVRLPIQYDDEQYKEDKQIISRLGEQFELTMNERALKDQTKLMIEDVEVFFPVKPYDVQVTYMKEVILALNNKKHALLQSPTGTGKTLSLLCAVLSWLRKQRKVAYELNQDSNEDTQPLIKIIYASRTHGQLKDVIKELKKTAFKPKLCIMGSKDKMCIKQEFRGMKGSQLNQACQKAISSKKRNENDPEGFCQFFQKENLIWLAGASTKDIMDIEELRSFGLKNRCCPYFFERHRKEAADLILMPYNYLLESQFTNTVDVTNTIVIFDEAHNVSAIAEEGYSFSITTSELQDAYQEFNRWLDLIVADGLIQSKLFGQKQEEDNPIPKRINMQMLRGMAQTMQCFVQYMFERKTDKRMEDFNALDKEKKERGFVQNGVEIFDLLFKYTQDHTQQQIGEIPRFQNGINAKNIDEYCEIGERVKEIMIEIVPGYHFENWLKFIRNIRDLYKEDERMKEKKSKEIKDIEQGLMQVENKFEQNNLKQQTNWTDNPINHFKLCIMLNENSQQIRFDMWCLDPGYAFNQLVKKGVYNILLTSGTLSPFGSWESELRLKFEHQLSNNHNLDAEKNLLAGIILKGQKGTPMNFQSSNRGNEMIYEELGLMLLNTCLHIPNGVLVIFSSYNLMNKCRFAWGDKEKQILTRLNKIKQCFWEPTISSEMDDTFNQYKDAAKKTHGALMFAVCRGKVAEGIDFKDELCRGVFIIGVPFLPWKDKRIEVKMAHIDRIYHDNTLTEFKKVNSKEWYRQHAIRSSNQALGRAIRHKDDFGAVYLCDLRFEREDLKCEISGWVRPVLKIFKEFKDVVQQTRSFFQAKREDGSIKILDESLQQNLSEFEGNNNKKRQLGIQFFGLNAANLTKANKPK